MPVLTQEPLTCTRGIELSPIPCLEPVVPILYFGQQVAVAIWNLTGNLGPFNLVNAVINICGAGCFGFKPLIPEWSYYKIDPPAACGHARATLSSNKEGLQKSLVHRPMSQTRSEHNSNRRQGGVEFENENIPELIRTSQPKSGRRTGLHDKCEDGRTLQPRGPTERGVCRDGDVDRRTKVGISTSPSRKKAVEAE
ncbi:hypothetical protein B0H13DRAFT_1889496 [Mycena leptocephala]|nr:hypothetical protein B0H13DRAFT_1889496 [Mycena leptocephala]